MKGYLTILSVGLVLFLAISVYYATNNPLAEKPEQAAEAPAEGGAAAAGGEQLFQNTCAACHGADLSGGAGPSLKGVGSKLSKDDILGIIQNGRGGMPGGLVSGADAEAIATWLSEQK